MARYRKRYLEPGEDENRPHLLLPTKLSAGMVEDLQTFHPHVAQRVRDEHGDLDKQRLGTLLATSEMRAFCAVAIGAVGGKGWKGIHPVFPDELQWPQEGAPGYMDARMKLLRYLGVEELTELVQEISPELGLTMEEEGNSDGPSAGPEEKSGASTAEPAGETSEP